ncbi:MAG TPA: MMPL family transporter [bacterium]|nr:MMPL family transporter [bacterium]
MTPTKRIASFLTAVNLKLWPLILIGVIALSAASIPRTIQLFKNISTDPVDLLPRENPNVQALLKVRDKLEKGVRTSIVFESDDPEATLRFLADTVEKLNHEPYVGRVIARKIGYDFFDKYKMLFVSLEDLRTIRDRIDRRIQREKLRGLYIDLENEGDSVSFKDIQEKYGAKYAEETKSEYNVSPDGRIYSIFVESGPESTGLSAASKFQDKMEDFVATLAPKTYHPTMKVYFSGATKVLEYRALVKDLKRVGIISGILLFIPLLIRFRNPLNVLSMFLPLAVAMPISFAAASYFVAKLNVSTSFLFAILGGLGIENGIHIFSRYHEDRTSGHERRHAINQIYEHTGRSILTSVASVAVTFLLLLINEFRGFSEFGLISGLGLWVIFFVYFLFMPSLLIFLEKIRVLRFHRAVADSEPAIPVKAKWLTVSLGVFSLFTVFSFIVTPFIGFEYDSKKTRAEIPEVIEAKKKQRMTTRRVNNPAAVVIYSSDEAEALHEAVEKRKEEDKLSPTIDTSRSYYDLVPSDQDEKLKVIGEIQALLKDDTIRLVKGEQKKDLDRFREALDKTAPIKEGDVPPEVEEVFKGKPEVPGELFYINAIPELELDDGQNAMRFAEDVGKIETKAGVYYPSSDGVVYGLVLKTMLADSKTVMIVSLLSVMFFVFIDFRSVRKTAIVMASIVLGVFWLLGVIYIFGIKLNFYNMIIIPAVMGMSIDNSIHIYHRYEEMGRGSLAKVLGSTGVAAMLASLTNASGFFGLLFCVHRGLYSIGLLAVIGVGTCFLSTLVFLPALLQFLEHLRFDRKEVVP